MKLLLLFLNVCLLLCLTGCTVEEVIDFILYPEVHHVHHAPPPRRTVVVHRPAPPPRRTVVVHRPAPPPR
ncbi:MAG: hypothetical protein E7044_12560, partial [Lentisphaerae bacterium]|nr:hypothetical protein [Lentisphaerota bacterium]